MNEEATSPFRQLMTRFFGVPGKPPLAAPAPAPKGEDFVKELDKIAGDAQKKLVDFTENIKHKAIKRYILAIDFSKSPKIQFPHDIVRPPPRRKKPKLIPAPTSGTFTPRGPKERPINPIFEAVVENWAKTAKEFDIILKEIEANLQGFVNNLIKTSGYSPAKTDLRTVARELKRGRFPNVDKESARQIIEKLNAIYAAYQESKQWLGLFERTAQKQSKRKP